MARAAGAPVEEGRALATLGAADADHDEGVRMIRAGRALLERAGAAADFVFMTFSYETGLLDGAGRFDDTIEAARAGIEFTGRHGMHRNHQTWLEAIAASTLIKLGRWTEADTILESAILKGPTGITRLAVQLSRAELQFARGELAAAAESAADGRRAVQGDHPLAGRRFEILAALDLAIATSTRPARTSAKASPCSSSSMTRRHGASLLARPPGRGRPRRTRPGRQAGRRAGGRARRRGGSARPHPPPRGGAAGDREIAALSHTCRAEFARGRGAPRRCLAHSGGGLAHAPRALPGRLLPPPRGRSRTRGAEAEARSRGLSAIRARDGERLGGSPPRGRRIDRTPGEGGLAPLAAESRTGGGRREAARPHGP